MINFDYCYKATCNIPRTYREEIDSSDAHCWVEAMHEELESLKENNIFELTNLAEGKKTVGSKWVYTTKENLMNPEDIKQDSLLEDSARKGYRLLRNLLPYSKHHLNTHLDANGGAI